ncbi:unnamed protein product [Adineta steineri]|uniref:adenosine deaminase n=1 Tax=Adineta steineri TaxID=433720 RepID=A0A813VI10_9BILA|nr:unnamed protein product [Adineta steineri]
MIVEVLNDYSAFLFQFAPYTDNITQTSDRSCLISYFDYSQFIYAVALGIHQSTYDIFFVGEMIDLDKQIPLENRTFVGILSYTGSLTTIDCDTFYGTTQFIPGTFVHQEHLVMVTDSIGSVVYGFSDLFTFSYTAATDNLVVHETNSLSPSISFLPFAVDYGGSFGVVAGFLDNGRNSRVKYHASIILFSISASTAIATPISSWNYSASATSWQSGLTNVGADQYAAKYDMSVSINPITTQVLVGIQSINTVFLFHYTTTALALISSMSPSQAIGFGKGVAWLSYTLNRFAILVNVYSTDYVWSSSKIYIYDSTLTNISSPISIFPNIQQPLYNYMSPVFLNIITTPDNLVLIDNQGDLFVIVSAPVGYYSSTVGPTEQIIPAFSSQLPCIPGTYKNITGIGRCIPCPAGTKNDGTNLTLSTCTGCAINTFCPFGSTSDSISNDQLSNVVQALVYPSTPDMNGIDDILFFTLFSIDSSPRCILISPIFWALIVGAIVAIIGSTMLTMKHCTKHPKAVDRYNKLEAALKQADVIGAGEMWVGGLTTFSVLVLLIACYIFSAKYYNSYPIETAGPSTYACDTTIRNAQFTSGLQPLSIPVSDSAQAIVDLLNNQPVNLNVAFLNTAYNCTSDTITLTYLLGKIWMPITTSISCNSSNYILSYNVLLPYREITIQFNLPNIYTIGGLRIGLSALGQIQSSTVTLQDLDFSQTFSQSGRMLGQDANIALSLTKVINDTSSLNVGDNDTYSGLWIGSFSMNYYESFFADADYLNAPVARSTNLTITISETSYYILNQQSPIARLPILIYHCFLFTTTVVGSFTFIFVISNLMILPVSALLVRKCKSKFVKNNRVSSNDNDLPISNSNLNSYVCVQSDCKSLADFLGKFPFFISIVAGDVDALERVAYEFVEDQAIQGVLYTEARYSPHFLTADILTPEQVIEAINRGFERGKKEFHVDVRTLLCCIRPHPEWSMEIVELAHKYRSAGVVGIDLAAGDEHEHVVAPHVAAFQRATELGIHRTVHAGESGLADSVRQAIEQCHAERIGHGYAIIDDPTVYELIHSRDIHLECCLTSSLQTNAVGKYAPKDCDIEEKHLMLNGQETNTKLHLHMTSKKEVWHPIHHFARDHLNFSLSCDDPSVSQITIEHEYKHALVDLKLSPAQLTQCIFNAARSSFLPEKEKDELIKRLLVNYIPKGVLKHY